MTSPPRTRPRAGGARARRPRRRGSVRTRARRPAARRRAPRNRLAWVPLLVVAVVTAAVVALVHGAGDPGPGSSGGSCAVPGTDLRLTTEQAASAATIAAVGRARGLPERAVVIALATAQQESGLRNLDHGDRDSLGLFQQRPSMGWGTPEQVQDPVYAAGTFYDHLVRVPRWDTGRLTEVAQAVQRSGFPEAYQKHEPMAQQLTTALGTGALSCGYDAAEPTGRLSARTAAAAEAVERELRVPADEEFGAVSVDPAAGWPGATWAVAHAERLQLASVAFAGRTWTAGQGWADSSAGDDAVRLELVT